MVLDQIKEAMRLDSLTRVDSPLVDYLFEWSVGGKVYHYAVPKITRSVDVWLSRFVRWGYVERRDEAAMQADLIAAIRSTCS